MTDMAQDAQRITNPVPVEIKNWPDPPAKKPAIKNSSLRTYLLIAAGGDGLAPQIADYEPNRVRMAVYVLDAPIGILDSIPSTQPDASTATAKPNSGGGVFVNSVQPYEFFGPDAWWINQLGTTTRVVVLKEYC